MTLKAEIVATESIGDSLIVTLSNVGPENKPAWKGYCPDIKLSVPLSQSANFTVGRTAEITVKLERAK